MTLSYNYKMLSGKSQTLWRDNLRLKTKNNTAPFYTGFNNWDAFEAVYNYLEPGKRGENIVYWRSVNAEVSAHYDQDQSEETFMKKGRARSLRPVGEFFIVMCRLRQGFHEEECVNTNCEQDSHNMD